MNRVEQIKNVLFGDDLSLEEANKIAHELSVKHWNMYFFITAMAGGTYRLSRYSDGDHSHHYLCGVRYNY